MNEFTVDFSFFLMFLSLLYSGYNTSFFYISKDYMLHTCYHLKLRIKKKKKKITHTQTQIYDFQEHT